MESSLHLPERQVARQQELRTVLDGKLTKLKELLSCCEEFFVDLESGGVWEGLAVVCAGRQWKVMEDVCQLFYKVKWYRVWTAVVRVMVNHSRSD